MEDCILSMHMILNCELVGLMMQRLISIWRYWYLILSEGRFAGLTVQKRITIIWLLRYLVHVLRIVCKLKNVCYWFSKQPIKFQLWKKKVAKGEKQFLKLKMLAKTKGWRNSSSCSSNKSWVLTICCNVLLAISPALYALTNSHNNPLK